MYDGVNRLLAGLYQEPDKPDLKTYSEIISYDLNGNINNLKRSGYFRNTAALLIDDLKYHYQGNRLTSIADASLDPSGYEGGGAPIKYDDNGNMTTMPDKGISAIAYNHLNLPQYLKINNTEINYLYRADGVKLRKDGYIPGLLGRTYSTEYLDGFHYTTSIDRVQPGIDPPFPIEPIEPIPVSEIDFALEEEAFERASLVETKKSSESLPDFFPTAEGFYDFRQNTYIYQYKDHLGNVRVSYKRDGHTTKVLDNNDYYPFGMNHLNAFAGAHFSVNGAWENYKYNGKELQETGMYDYGARMYMPDVGRWGVVDPLAEKARRWSPYTYAYNNPLRYIDPDGRENYDWVRKGNEIFYDSRVTEDNVKSLHGNNAVHLGSNPTYTTKNSNGDIVDNLNLNSNGSITDNTTGNDIASATTLGGTVVTAGDAYQSEDSWSFYADGKASIDVGPQLRVSGKFAGVELGLTAQQTVSNGDILNPGDPYAVTNKTFGGKAGVGGKVSTESVRGNNINTTTEINASIVNIAIDNNYIKVNVGAGLEAGLIMFGFTLSGEVGVKIKK